MRAESDSKAGQAEVRGRRGWGNVRKDSKGFHWSKTKAGHQQKGKSVNSWSKPEVLVQHKGRI